MDWFIITKEGCPNCDKLKDYLHEQNQQFGTVEMPANKNSELKPKMVQKLKSINIDVKETYPMTFKLDRDGKVKYVGGYTDVVSMDLK